MTVTAVVPLKVGDRMSSERDGEFGKQSIETAMMSSVLGSKNECEVAGPQLSTGPMVGNHFLHGLLAWWLWDGSIGQILPDRTVFTHKGVLSQEALLSSGAPCCACQCWKHL